MLNSAEWNNFLAATGGIRIFPDQNAVDFFRMLAIIFIPAFKPVADTALASATA
jgi:hypothetical protein